MAHIELPVISYTAAAAVLLIVLLNSHIRNRGSLATAALVSSLVLLNTIYGLDSILWSGTARDASPVWCDISTNLLVGFNILAPATCLCISLRIEFAFSQPDTMKAPWKFAQLSLCVILPPIYMVLHYIVEGPRYILIEDIGCRPSVFPSVLTIFIFWYPPFMVSLAAILCACIALRHFYRSSPEHTVYGKSAGCEDARDRDHYWRLLFASIFIALTFAVRTALDLTIALLTTGSALRTFTWSTAHTGPAVFEVDGTPTILRSLFFVSWWMIPTSSVIFVALLFVPSNIKDTCTGMVARMRGEPRNPLRPRPLLMLRRTSSFGSGHAYSLDKPSRVSACPPVLALMDFAECERESAVSTSSSATLFDPTLMIASAKLAKAFEPQTDVTPPPKRPPPIGKATKLTSSKRASIRPPILVNLDLINLPNFTSSDGAYSQLSSNVDRTAEVPVPGSVASTPSRYSQLSAIPSSLKTLDVPIDAVTEFDGDADASFASATQDYLQSPTGRAVFTEQPMTQDSPTRSRRAGDRVFGANWPQPPSSIPLNSASPTSPTTPSSLRSILRKPVLSPTTATSSPIVARSTSNSSSKSKRKNDRRHAQLEDPKSFLPL